VMNRETFTAAELEEEAAVEADIVIELEQPLERR